MLTKQEDLLGRGAQVESKGGREPRRTALLRAWPTVLDLMVIGLASRLSLANHSDSGSSLGVWALLSQDGFQQGGFWEVGRTGTGFSSHVNVYWCLIWENWLAKVVTGTLWFDLLWACPCVIVVYCWHTIMNSQELVDRCRKYKWRYNSATLWHYYYLWRDAEESTEGCYSREQGRGVLAASGSRFNPAFI